MKKKEVHAVQVEVEQDEFAAHRHFHWGVQVPWWVRVLALPLSLLCLVGGLLFLAVASLLALITMLTMGYFKKLLRANCQIRKWMRWQFVLSLSFFLTLFNPNLGLILIVTYCFFKSSDFPYALITRFYNVDIEKFAKEQQFWSYKED